MSDYLDPRQQMAFINGQMALLNDKMAFVNESTQAILVQAFQKMATALEIQDFPPTFKTMIEDFLDEFEKLPAFAWPSGGAKKFDQFFFLLEIKGQVAIYQGIQPSPDGKSFMPKKMKILVSLSQKQAEQAHDSVQLVQRLRIKTQQARLSLSAKAKSGNNVKFGCFLCLDSQTRSHSTHYHLAACHLQIWKFFCHECQIPWFHANHFKNHMAIQHGHCDYCQGKFNKAEIMGHFASCPYKSNSKGPNQKNEESVQFALEKVNVMGHIDPFLIENVSYFF